MFGKRGQSPRKIRWAPHIGVAVLGIAFVGFTAFPAHSVPIDVAFTEIVTTNTPIPEGEGNFTGFAGGGIAFDGTDFAFLGNGGLRITPRGNASPRIPQRGIYSTAGGLHVVADMSTPVPISGPQTFFSSFFPPEMGGGQTIFGAAYPNTTGGTPTEVFSDIGGVVDRVVGIGQPIPDGGGDLFSGIGQPVIDGDNFAFSGSPPGFSQARGIYKNIGSGLETVADQNKEPINTSSLFYGDVDLSGERVAFTFGGARAIAVEAGAGFDIIADSNTLVPDSTGTFTVIDLPSFDGQSVAFVGIGESGTFGPGNGRIRGVYTDEGGTLRRVADLNTLIPGTPDTFRGFGATKIADGHTAFQARLPVGDGVFFEFDGMLSKVIATGDLLFGQEVTLVEMAVGGTFGNNAVGFFAVLADGTQGIYRADLTPLVTDPPGGAIPEPTTALLLGVGLTGMGIAIWRRRVRR